MRVRSLREKLDQIPGAMIDVPPGDGRSGNDEGVVGSVLHRPKADKSMGERYPSRSEVFNDEGVEFDDFEPVFEWGAESDESIRRLGEAADEAIRKSVKFTDGSDALGHYLSFHIRGAQWGATVKASGIAWLVRNYFGALSVDAMTKARLAFYAILQHELFHFATDFAVAQAELGQRQAWWLPAHKARRARGEEYSHCEEKLANAWMLRAFRTSLPAYRVKGKQNALKAFVGCQPPGYRDALDFKWKDWAPDLHDLMHGYAWDAGCVDDNPLLWGWGYEWPCQFPVWPRINWRDCSIHLVDDSARFGVPPGWLSLLNCLSVVEEDDRFRKQLAALGPRQQESWIRAKQRALTALTNGHDFKPWPRAGRNVWSMRVDRAYRAHLLRNHAQNKWIALEIGDHKSMGHG